MEEIEIKNEFDERCQTQCQTCLSIGRKLQSLGKLRDIYKKLFSETIQQKKTAEDNVQICWECHSILYKVDKFIDNALRARELLQLGQNYIHDTFSNLTTIIFTDCHPDTVYVNDQSKIHTETKLEHNEKEEILTNILQANDNDYDAFNDSAELNLEDLKEECKIKSDITEPVKKRTNRWAKKRAVLNKKPKYKILNYNDCNIDQLFKRVTDKEACERHKCEKDSEYWKSKYRCDKCVLGFKNESLLSRHNKRWHIKDQNPYICNICTKYFKTKKLIIKHIEEHDFKYTCILCSDTCRYKRKDVVVHMGKEHRSILQCIKCKLKFGNRRQFFKHYKEWHEKYICDYCGISFKMRYCIKDHIRKQHSPFECKPCQKRFARYNGLWLHNKTTHQAQPQTAYCVECDKRYTDIYRYRWHLANSVQHRPRKRVRIPCPECDKVFTKNIYMKDHYNLVHLKFYKYRCEECDKNFIRNADLVKHKRRVHEGILPPKNKICYICGRGFSTNKILTNHVRTHTGERPHACVHCGARFAQTTALLGHVRALHQNRPPHK